MPIEKKYISVRFNETRLMERNRPLAILLEMSDFLSISQGSGQVWEGVLSKVMGWFGLTAGRIYLLDESGRYLDLTAFKGIEAAGLERIEATKGFSGRSVQTRSFIAQYVSELEDKQRAELLASKGLKIILCVPLIAMGRVLGVMNLATDRDIELDPAAIDLLIAIGNQIASAVLSARLYEDLKAKMTALKLQKEAVELFAYSISHDLKSPAVGIHGLATRLNRLYGHVLQETGGNYCRLIAKASEQIVRLVDRINAYIMAKEAPFHFERVRVKEVMEGIRSEFFEALNARNVKWSEPQELPTLVADRISITRVFRNLVDNALKYGGSELTQITIDYREEGDQHVISIHDDGVALDVDDVDGLFQVFHRHKTSRGMEGTGLGLATVKEIAERHSGRVWLESGAARGTAFFISISKRIKPVSEGSE